MNQIKRPTAEMRSEFFAENQVSAVYLSFWERPLLPKDMISLYTNEWRDFIWYERAGVIRMTTKKTDFKFSVWRWVRIGDEMEKDFDIDIIQAENLERATDEIIRKYPRNSVIFFENQKVAHGCKNELTGQFIHD